MLTEHRNWTPIEAVDGSWLIVHPSLRKADRAAVARVMAADRRHFFHGWAARRHSDHDHPPIGATLSLLAAGAAVAGLIAGGPVGLLVVLGILASVLSAALFSRWADQARTRQLWRDRAYRCVPADGHGGIVYYTDLWLATYGHTARELDPQQIMWAVSASFEHGSDLCFRLHRLTDALRERDRLMQDHYYVDAAAEAIDDQLKQVRDDIAALQTGADAYRAARATADQMATPSWP